MVALDDTFKCVRIDDSYIEGDVEMKIERKIILIMCLLFLVMGISLLFGLKEARECMGNPFTYGANKITNEDTGDLYCSCSFASFKYASFYFNKDSVGTSQWFDRNAINITEDDNPKN